MTDTIEIPPVERIDPRRVYCPDDNPNHMPPKTYAALKKAILTDGFLQPVLVIRGGPSGYDYTIEDGEHRTKAMIELGAKTYPAVVAADTDQAKRIARRLGLNRIRGVLDLIEVSRDLEQLSQAHNWSAADMEVTGFDDEEINSLLRATAATIPEDLLGEVPDSEPPPNVRRSTSKRNLTLKFDSEVDCVKVKNALLAQSDSDDPARGLLALLGIDPEEE